MSLRKLWIISIDNARVVYSRSFPSNELSALKKNALPVEVFDDKTFSDCVFRILSLKKYQNPDEVRLDCKSLNQLPVIRLTDDIGRSLWPILIVQQDRLLFCALPLIQNQSSQLVIDEPGITQSLRTLQSLIVHLVTEKVSSYECHESREDKINPSLSLYIYIIT